MASKKRLGPVDPDHQAALILAAFATWLGGSSDRAIVLRHDDDGWIVGLNDNRITRGRTLQDAAAQAGTVINADGAE